ncbi:carboxylesterase [Streptomyces sp. CB03234]|uniref:alpha/beta fold hydrolase n=1 Tax=Streptomyces sp. (strain CB03234) TaxID=1703937 RepID=UPI00093A7264|nr:alpha/beta hydrolase [Streptomyces sp. CB03234]OKK08240.1 carboxylesterase [Streptomyces sp. CB03234]
MATDAFLAAYDAVLAQWPEGTGQSTVPTPYGSTHVNSHGPRNAPPVVLLHGGGATSTVWYATAAELGRTHRVHAVDTIGDPGRSVAGPGDRPVRTVADLMAWLDAVLDGLGLDSAAVCGHSYGAWTGLHYALRSPRRVTRLVLLDPTNCFAGFSPRYLLRALPMLLRPTPARNRLFLEWETRGVPLDPAWLRLDAHTAGFPAARPVNGPRPSADALRTLDVPTLVLLAERSRAHDVRKVAAAARDLPAVRTEILPGATHHALPLASPPGTDRRIADFLTRS